MTHLDVCPPEQRRHDVADLQDVQPLQWAYSQPNINWTFSDRNAAIAPAKIVEGSGDSWAYYDMVNADALGGESAAVSIITSLPFTSLLLKKIMHACSHRCTIQRVQLPLMLLRTHHYKGPK